MQRIRIQKKRVTKKDDGRYEVLPLDPRDPDVMRVKGLDRARRAQAGT